MSVRGNGALDIGAAVYLWFANSGGFASEVDGTTSR